ncbi:hypothetical protein OKW50_005458 [Paraburkholderia youngii]
MGRRRSIDHGLGGPHVALATRFKRPGKAAGQPAGLSLPTRSPV